MVRIDRSSLLLLRISMGLFLALWGVDKIMAVEGATGIFERFYLFDPGAVAVRALGALEVGLGIVLISGRWALTAAWTALIVNLIPTLASWRQILDPWGLFGLTRGGTHLFLASIVVIAVSIVLVIEVRRSA